MKAKAKPLTPLERLADFTRRIIAVPKAEIDKQEKKWKAHRKARRAKTRIA